MQNEISQFRLQPADFTFVGRDLARPESVVCERDGTLWVSDARAAVTRIAPDGTQTLLGDPLVEATGIAVAPGGDLLVAALGGGGIFRVTRSGVTSPFLTEVEGRPLGASNYVFCDDRGRTWISVSSRSVPWHASISSPDPTGYIILCDERGARIVADGIRFCNEIRIDPSGQYLYAAETMRSRLLRFPLRPDGSLGEREVFGPESYGPGGFVDGFTFDARGNVWLALVCRNAICVLTPDGTPHVVFEDPQPDALAQVEARLADGSAGLAELALCAGKTLQLPASIAFGGPDLRTCYVGSLGMTYLPSFRAPFPGIPPLYPHAAR